MKRMFCSGVVFAATLALSACQGNKKEEPKAAAPKARPAAAGNQSASARTSARPRAVEVRPARTAGQAKSRWTMNFDAVKPGSLPENLDPRTGKWTILQDAQAKSGKGVVAQTASSDDSSFNVLLVKDGTYGDLRISVWIRAVQGKVDQGGGLVWRAKDEKNYYVARYNPLEDNLRLYYVKEGRRKMLTGTSLRLDHKAWHHMVVTMVGDHITVSLDGKQWLDFHDKTFSERGMVGLWTKADARSRFDDFSVAFMAPGKRDARASLPRAGRPALARKPGRKTPSPGKAGASK